MKVDNSIRNNKYFKPLLIVLLIIILGAVLIGIKTFNNKSKNINNASISNMGKSNYKPEEIDTENINLSNEAQGLLKDDNAIKDYKIIMAQYSPTNELLDVINKKLEDGFDMSDIAVCYSFLYEKNGNIKDLDNLLNQRKKGKSFDKIFVKYNKDNKEFKPSDFEDGFIESQIESGLTTDDIMIADEISQKDLGPDIKSLLDRKKSGETWRDIKGKLGFVKLEEEYKSYSITSTEVSDYANETGLTKDQVIEALLLARKNKVDEKTVIEEIKNEKSIEEIYMGIFTERYN